MTAPPYRTHVTVRNSAKLRVLVQLHFNEAADFDKRTGIAEYVVNLSPVGEKSSYTAPTVDVDTSVPASSTDAPTPGGANAGRPARPLRNRAESGKAIMRFNFNPSPDIRHRTVLQFITQETKYDLPSVGVVKVEDKIAQICKRKRE